MRELERDTSWGKAPILALLVAGLALGGGLEYAANLDDEDAVETRIEVIEVVPGAPVEPAPPVVELIPPPPPEPAQEDERDITAAPVFTPYTVAPTILNRREIIEAMEKAYPPLLRDAGVGGTVKIFFLIDEEGSVVKTLIDGSSGHAALDDAALSVAGVYRFSPALNRDEPVPVWVSFPITFQVR